jgi:hypothetical protein
MALGKGAKPAPGKPLRADIENAIEAGAAVFPSNHGSELDELAVREVKAELVEKLPGHVCGRLAHHLRQAQDQALALIKMRAGFKVVQLAQLIFGDPGFSAPGRMNVESKRAAD